MVRIAAGAYNRFDFHDDDGTANLFETAPEYLAGVPDDCGGVDVAGVRARLRAAFEDPTRVEGARIAVDDHRPEAYPADYEYAEALE